MPWSVQQLQWNHLLSTLVRSVDELYKAMERQHQWLLLVALVFICVPQHASITQRVFVGCRRLHTHFYGTKSSTPPPSGHSTPDPISPNSGGKQTYSQYKSIAQMNKLNDLLSQPRSSLTESQLKELQGLSKQDTYDAAKFTQIHQEFKREHNLVFAALGAYCSGTTADLASPLFYLDGKDGGTTSVLQSCGYRLNHLHTANMFPDSCAALRGLFPSLNVYSGRADEALLTGLKRVPFAGYYLDGCGGSPLPVIRILEAIMAEDREQWLPAKIAIGGCGCGCGCMCVYFG